jgi:very-short-patch-repair endonuclease
MPVTCEICKKRFNVVNILHLRTHGYTNERYLAEFPGAQLFDAETKNKMKESSRKWHNENVKILSEETKNKISNAHRGKKKGPRTEEFKQKMRECWAEHKDQWSEAIKNAYTPERREKLRETQRQKLLERVNPLLNWKENRLEKDVRQQFETLNLTVIRNKRSDTKILGAYRFFDFYIPELNMLVEVDGEYWHKNRTEVDTAKMKYALENGYDFVRISDRKRTPVKYLLEMSKADRIRYSDKLVKSRIINNNFE